MGSPAGRLLDLLSLLQARPRWTGPELAARLGTTERTVRRDVTRLRDLGYPVEAELGPQGGYRLGPGKALPPLLLTDDEAVAVTVGLRNATSGGGIDGYDEAAIAALAKLEQVLPGPLRERVRALTTATTLVRRGAAGPASEIDPEVLLTLAQGCRAHERVGFAYCDADGNETERRVEPYGLVNVERRWYLVAFDVDRRGWRTFRLDRMAGATRTGHRFPPVDDPPDAAAMVLDGISNWPADVQARVVLDAPVEEAAAHVPPTVGRVHPHDDPAKSILQIGSDELGWTARYLAGLPVPFEVVEPPELRSELRQLAARLARS